LKKNLKIILWTLLTIAVLVTVVIVGFPTRIRNKNIDSGTLSDIKQVQQILSASRDKISQDSTTVFSPLTVSDDYGYVEKSDVDQLFPFLKIADRNKIKSLFDKGQVLRIDIMRPKCIRFTLKQSFNNYFLVNSWQTLALVYNDKCVCDCQELRSDEETVMSVNLGSGWYKVTIVTKRAPPHA
jgi:hypothetical protein